jgi:hypothetical protein
VEGVDLLRIDFPTLLIVPDWIERHCPVPDGDAKGERMSLYDWQLHATVHHYRVKPKARAGEKAKAFHYRRSQVIAPQKLGKGPWSATIICCEAAGPARFAGWAKGGETYRCSEHHCGCGWVYEYQPGEAMGRPWRTPLIQLLATAEDQTDNVYLPLQSMIRNGPLGDFMKVGEEFTRIGEDGRIDVVTSSALARLGNPITFALQDETQLYTRQNKLITVAETQRRGLAGMGGRSLETTNAPDPSIDSTALRTRKSKAKDIFRFYDPPPEGLDYKNPSDRRKIHAYNYRGSPHVEIENIDSEALEIAEIDPAQAARYFGNLMQGSQDAAFDAQRWRSADLCKPDLVIPEGELIVLGVDGARYQDALGVIATDVVTGHQWPVGIWERPELADDDYEHPFDEIDAAVSDAFGHWQVWRTYIDPQYIDYLVDLWAGRWGTEKIKAWPTHRIRAMAYSLRSYRQAMTSGDLTQNGDEAFARHISNSKRSPQTMTDDDGKPLWLLRKETPAQKIDAAMAGCLSWECRGDAVAAGAKKRQKRKAAFV